MGESRKLLLIILNICYFGTKMAKVGFEFMKRVMFAALIFIAAILITAHPASGRNYKHKLEDYLDAAHRLWGFSGAVLVADHGRILLNRGYGMSNQDLGEPNTPETRFFIGSITKQFTAAAILALQEDSLLNIDDSIAKYLPDYPPDPGNRITIKELLTHTSGIPNYTDDAELIVRRSIPMTPEQIIEIFKYRPLEFEPGSRFKYSNSGYVLLGKIIEAVSGQSYEAFMHHRIFKPAGMNNTGYGRRESGIPNRADGYTTSSNGRVIDALPVDFSVMFSSGALYSTVEDMHRWDGLLYTEKLLKKESINSMFEPFKGNYGFGWYIESRFGRRHAYHGGFLDGFNTITDRWLDDSLEIIVFSNEDEAPVAKIARGISAIAFDQRFESPLRKRAIATTPRRVKEYEGVYRIDEGAYQFISLEDDTLYTHLRGMPLQAILPQSDDTFFFACDNNKILAFRRDSQGQVLGF